MWPRICLAAILAVAAALRFWRLGETGFITPYYLAGVRSMMAGWHNFLFNSFDPAGFVSLDKPPVAFWIQTASAELFGFSPFSVLLPQALEGLAAIALLYLLVRRWAGMPAGLLAALFLALTPINVAVDRSNNTESCLTLVLLLAAWALMRAIDTGRARFLLISAALVGIGFNVKMLVAFGVVPAFLLVYAIGAPVERRRSFAYLAGAGAVLVAVALSWSLVYELTPPQSRPFVDSSRDNSMLELVVGHNFVQRFVRPARAARRVPAPDITAAAQTGTPQAAVPGGRDFVPAGPLRLAAPRLASQMGWLLPLTLIGGTAAWFLSRLGRRLAPERLGLVLWGGWALAYGVVFSAAGGLFHAYYLAVLAPALAALAGIGAATLWSLYRAGGAAALLLPAAIVASGLWQANILDEYLAGHLAIGQSWIEWVLPATAGIAAAGLLLTRLSERGAARVATLGLVLSLALPAAWSIGTATAAGISGFPGARPPFLTDAAETQRRRWASVAGSLDGDPKLITYLRENHGAEDYLLAAVNARQAAPIIIATGAPVIALGGFSGGDPILSVEEFARLVAEKRLRFALIGDGSPGLRRIFGEETQKPLIDWIRQNGRPVDPSLWRSVDGVQEVVGGGGRRRRGSGAEAVGAELYDLGSATGGG
ncbi:MAG TPA: glycosyltransferase family 39 protein [Stellaceae bacterium]|jgi:4-amino-4-deoxy-L-arabinose transferase-like glycosyltransferase|nr:glycosyltransferase family 39 protein [Stellaceae bacterium]